MKTSQCFARVVTDMTAKWLSSIFIFTLLIQLLWCEKIRKVTKKRKDEYPENMWKKEYEDELTDAMISMKEHKNLTKPALPQPRTHDNEAVLEKLIDGITNSEKYLKKIDSIDFKLNRLDIEVHEKTNAILKLLSESVKNFRLNTGMKKFENLIDRVLSDLSMLKVTIDQGLSPKNNNEAEGQFHAADMTLHNRLNTIDNTMKTMLEGVENIIATISEVKSRQYSRIRSKPDGIPASSDLMSVVNEIKRTMYDQRSKKCDCKEMYRNGRVDRSERYPTDCNEIQMQGFNISGIYKIKPDDYESFYVLCDLTTAGGGWTVFQNRFDGSQNFFKLWTDYKYGFGNLAGEFWMGLDKLHYLTTQKLYELRIEIETAQGHDAYAGYSVFSIGPEIEGYRISTLGTYYGTAGDSLSYHAGQKFSTVDLDNDEWKDGSCSVEHGGAWWYKECDKSNLNGNYILDGSDESKGKSMYWISFKGTSSPLAKTRMMIRPLPASRPSEIGDLSRVRSTLGCPLIPVKIELVASLSLHLMDLDNVTSLTDKILNGPTPVTHDPHRSPSDVKKPIHQHYRYDDSLMSNDAFF